MQIRHIDSSELPVIERLARCVWPVSFPLFLTQEQITGMLDSIYDQASLRQEMEELGHQFWVATLEGKDAGFISAYLEEGTVWIKKLYILPEVQGKGVGKELMKTALSHFKKFEHIALYVNERNYPAIDYYEQHGFACKELVKVKMGPFDFMDWVMEKAA